MFLPPPAPPALVSSLPVATVAQPSVAQKVLGSVSVNQQESLLLSGLNAWQTAYTKATAATLSVPSSSSGLFPLYGFQPPVPASNTSWQYGVSTYQGLPAAYVCLSAAGNVTLQQAIDYGQRFYSQNYYVSGSCGSTSNGGGSTLTFWLQLAPAAQKALEAAQNPGSPAGVLPSLPPAPLPAGPRPPVQATPPGPQAPVPIPAPPQAPGQNSMPWFWIWHHWAQIQSAHWW